MNIKFYVIVPPNKIPFILNTDLEIRSWGSVQIIPIDRVSTNMEHENY